jgi:hypothetical protein
MGRDSCQFVSFQVIVNVVLFYVSVIDYTIYWVSLLFDFLPKFKDSHIRSTQGRSRQS